MTDPPRRLLGLLTAFALLAGPTFGQSAPSLVVPSADGSLVLVELGQPGLYRRDPDGRVGRLFAAGTKPKPRMPLYAVSALAVDRDGTVYAGDRATGEVYRVGPGSKASEPMTAGALEIPSGLAVDPQGDLIASDLRLGTVSRIPRSGGRTVLLVRVPAPRGVAIGTSGAIVVLSMGPDQVIRVDSDGKTSVLAKGKPFTFPFAIVRDAAHGRYLVSDPYAATIWGIDDAGAVVAWVRGKPLVRPEGLAIDPAGILLVADPGASRIFRVLDADHIEPLPGPP